jgi:hypothetical protein
MIPVPQEKPTGATDVLGTGAEADPQDSPQAPADPDTAPSKDERASCCLHGSAYAHAEALIDASDTDQRSGPANSGE